SKRAKTRVAENGRPLSDDPSTIAGAIRVVLFKNSDGLKRPELSREVAILRPGTKPDDLASAIHAMIRRREVSREGYHRNYTYKLTPSTIAKMKRKAAAKKEASVSE